MLIHPYVVARNDHIGQAREGKCRIVDIAYVLGNDNLCHILLTIKGTIADTHHRIGFVLMCDDVRNLHAATDYATHLARHLNGFSGENLVMQLPILENESIVALIRLANGFDIRYSSVYIEGVLCGNVYHSHHQQAEHSCQFTCLFHSLVF